MRIKHTRTLRVAARSPDEKCARNQQTELIASARRAREQQRQVLRGGPVRAHEEASCTPRQARRFVMARVASLEQRAQQKGYDLRKGKACA